MVLSERLREELDRCEATNQRQLQMNGSEPHGNFRGLTDDEFADVETHPFWSEIRELNISDAPRLKVLPDLPRQLQKLRLYKTGVRTIPDPLPPTLSELILTENRGIQIPNEIPRRITFLVLQRNNLEELPFIHKSTRFTIQEPGLAEPFRSLFEEYHTQRQTQNTRRAFYRGLKEIWSKRKANVRGRARNVGTLRRVEKHPFSRLPESVYGEIASFLSGEPAHAAPEEQMAALQEKHGKLPRGLKGGTRKRRTRKIHYFLKYHMRL